MESFLDRTKDADLDQLVKELASRSHGHTRRSLRLKAWRLTVFGAYATKRIMDIVISALGMLLLSPLFLLIALAVKLSSPAYSSSLGLLDLLIDTTANARPGAGMGVFFRSLFGG